MDHRLRIWAALAIFFSPLSSLQAADDSFSAFAESQLQHRTCESYAVEVERDRLPDPYGVLIDTENRRVLFAVNNDKKKGLPVLSTGEIISILRQTESSAKVTTDWKSYLHKSNLANYQRAQQNATGRTEISWVDVSRHLAHSERFFQILQSYDQETELTCGLGIRDQNCFLTAALLHRLNDANTYTRSSDYQKLGFIEVEDFDSADVGYFYLVESNGDLKQLHAFVPIQGTGWVIQKDGYGDLPITIRRFSDVQATYSTRIYSGFRHQIIVRYFAKAPTKDPTGIKPAWHLEVKQRGESRAREAAHLAKGLSFPSTNKTKPWFEVHSGRAGEYRAAEQAVIDRPDQRLAVNVFYENQWRSVGVRLNLVSGEHWDHIEYVLFPRVNESYLEFEVPNVNFGRHLFKTLLDSLFVYLIQWERRFYSLEDPRVSHATLSGLGPWIDGMGLLEGKIVQKEGKFVLIVGTVDKMNDISTSPISRPVAQLLTAMDLVMSLHSVEEVSAEVQR